MRPDKREIVETANCPAMQALLAGGHLAEGDSVWFDENLPEADADGNPIFGFLVETDRIWAWKGEPIKIPELVKKDG